MRSHVALELGVGDGLVAQCIAVSCVVRLYCDRVLAVGRLIPQELNPEGRHLITRVNAGLPIKALVRSP